jgi:hypothetical protein
MERVRAVAEEWTADPATRELLAGALLALVALGALLFVFRLTNRLLRRVHAAIDARRLPALKIQSLEVVSADRVTDLLKAVARAARLVTLLLLLYAFVPLVLSVFPWTHAGSRRDGRPSRARGRTA